MRRSSAKRRSEQQRCTVTGTRGADTPLGTGRDDVICGLGGPTPCLLPMELGTTT